jgi:hypothetical protein
MLERFCTRYPRLALALVGALYVWASVSDAPYRLGDWAAR